MAEHTRVVNVASAEWEGTPADKRVYVGRAVSFKRLRGSVWGNPYQIGRDGTRQAVIARYARMLLRRPDLIQRIVPELQGKVLGCWCKRAWHRDDHDEPCHGDILAALADYDGELGPLCPLCLGRELEVEDCWQCHGEGRFHPADENPNEYDADEYEPCEECCGTGVTYWCACGKEQTDG